MPSERWTRASKAADMRRAATMDTTSQLRLLPKAICKRKKSELVDLLLEMATNDRKVLRLLQSRFEVELPKAELLRATWQAIVDATAFDDRQRNYNFGYDSAAYETVRGNFERLIHAGWLRDAMELALELMRLGSTQIAESDEGLMIDEIVACLNPVIKAVDTGRLAPETVSAWRDAMARADCGGFICSGQFAASSIGHSNR